MVSGIGTAIILGYGGNLVLRNEITVGELARALNALGATPREMMLILETIRSTGGLHAELTMQGR